MKRLLHLHCNGGNRGIYFRINVKSDGAIGSDTSLAESLG